MAVARRFGARRRFIRTSGNNLTETNFFTLGGLNLTLPDELMKENESPYAKNFRIFQDNDFDTRVAVSKRNGHAKYSIPLGETQREAEVSTLNAGDYSVGTTVWVAQQFTATATGRLTKIDLNIKNDSAGTGPLVVKIYSNNSGVPGTLLATSSILGGSITSSYAYISANFIEAPSVTNSTTYWVVLNQQAEGTNNYKVSTTNNTSLAKTSTSSGISWTSAAYSINYKTYISTDAPIKAIYRYYRSTTTPVTLIIAGTTLYSVNDSTGATTVISSTLSSTAVNYKFITANNCVYFVNGVENPKKLNGTSLTDIPGNPMTQLGASNYPIDICMHKGLLFLLGKDNKCIWSIEDGSSLEIFESTAFVYVPRVNTDDNVLAMLPYMDNLIFFNRNGKWALYGDRLANMQLKMLATSKGVAGTNALCQYGNFIYFVAPDGNIYIFNGATDKQIGGGIERIIKRAYNPATIRVISHDNKVRFYYAPSGSTALQHCVVYDAQLNYWYWDTEIYAGYATVFNSQTDFEVLVHGSSLVGAIYYAETGTSDLGKPILFEYWTKYYSFGHPSKKHRIKRLYVFFRAGSGPYNIDVQIDVNSANKPTSNPVNLGASGATWGAFEWGEGYVWGGDVLQPVRITVPGQAREHQIRFVQYGVDNPVDILGFTLYTRLRRPI
jgi:hypothetical protein